MGFIENTLHVKVTPSREAPKLDLPNFITSRYLISSAWIDRIKVFFLEPRTELDKVHMIKKHIHRIQENENCPAVIVTNHLTASQKTSFIHAGIPFVVPDRQLYLPFMGILLNYRNDPVQKEVLSLSPSAQVILLYLIKNDLEKIYLTDLTDYMDFSSMTISRGIKQLQQLGLVKTTKDKVQKVIIADSHGWDLFLKSEKFFTSPIKTEGYLPKSLIDQSYFKAGDSALAQYSMLNPPQIPCYAVLTSPQLRQLLRDELTDEENEVKVQLWKYDPALLTRTDTVDRLSLALSYKAEQDERILEAVEEILVNYKDN